MSLKDPPEYNGIFQYMVEHYEDPGKPSSEERFWVRDIEENQYLHLDGPVNPERVIFDSPEEAAERIEVFARAAGADVVGFCRVTPDIVFKGARVEGKYAVILGYGMDHEAMETAPEPPAGKEALRAYWRIGGVVMKVAEFIRYMGYGAVGHQVRTFLKDPPTVLFPLVAVHAGLGEIGRSGILISEEFGPRIRLGAVTTELELPEGKKKDLGVQEFCSRCPVCANECPGGAISMEVSLVRGHLKYTIDPYKCIPEFARYDGCGICIRVCPYNRPVDEMSKFLAAVKRLNEHHRSLAR